jgi:hypothetical protein
MAGREFFVNGETPRCLQLKNNESDVAKAVKILVAGGLVALPSETVYGLGANALNKQAVARIYEVKNRPADHPLIVHLHSMQVMGQWVEDVPAYATALAHFSKHTLPKWIYRSRRLWPNWDTLLPLQKTALLSIAYNRGTSLTGTRREEMREIVDLLKDKNLQGIAPLIRSMSHWHTLNGLQIRRHKEAILFECPIRR